MKLLSRRSRDRNAKILSIMLICVVMTLLSGCTEEMSDSVSLQYFGVSCTLITAPDGTSIVSDPYADLPRPAGLDVLPSDLAADVVTVSHAHFDHSNVDAVGGEPRIIREPGSYQVGMVKIAGYESYEGSPSGPSTIHNTVFVFEIGGIKIVHMGDAGLLTPPDLLAAVDEADVVIVNVDGYVLPFDQLLPQMQAINARTIIPSHYSIDGQDRFYTWATLEEFLRILPSEIVVAREGSEIQVTAGMPNQLLVLSPAALED